MLRRHVKGARNRLDLNDRVQVRIIRKRLKISDRQLSSVVQTVGNSIAAITKESNLRKGLPPVSTVPEVAGIVSAETPETAVQEADPSVVLQPG